MKTSTTMNFPMRLSTVDGTQRPARRFAACCYCLLSLLLPLTTLAQADAALFPPKPDPAVYVHDYANWLTPHEKTVLESKLRAYWDSTTTQIVVMIRPDIGDYDKAGYAFELGNRWGIGRADKDNGVVMLVKSQPPDRGIFIATGYGTEGALPDITAGRIIRNTMAPYFRQEQYFEGINAGTDDIIRALSGEFKAERSEELGKEGVVVLFVILLVFFLAIWLMIRAFRKSSGKWITHSGAGPVRRSRRDDDPLGGGWWMGGGSSGGGGGSGGWGGGGGSFGGGSFGGGGAGGDW
jgi:uncharacterized protein